MFKFDFHIDDADDLEDIFLASKINSLPSDKPSPDLEPFTEILIDHLVRVNFIQNHPPGTDWHSKFLLDRRITFPDILLPNLHPYYFDSRHNYFHST
jgi:hypothetical protein